MKILILILGLEGLNINLKPTKNRTYWSSNNRLGRNDRERNLLYIGQSELWVNNFYHINTFVQENLRFYRCNMPVFKLNRPLFLSVNSHSQKNKIKQNKKPETKLMSSLLASIINAYAFLFVLLTDQWKQCATRTVQHYC